MSKAASAAASVQSQAADAVDSATGAAKKKLDEVKDGTARSTHKLSGEVRAGVGTALRY
ncbi:hypothetical protein [Streptomyces sp. NPDC059957]|uniref:hypothetical protein n=1 Tax=unclassified Streptomyces TaxID=2593676 RepID=UPI00364D662A